MGISVDGLNDLFAFRRTVKAKANSDKTVFARGGGDSGGGGGDDGMRPKHIRVIADRYSPVAAVEAVYSSRCGTSVTVAVVQYILVYGIAVV